MWIQNDPRLGAALRLLDDAPPASIAVSAVSCWEVAVLHTRGRLRFECSLNEWMQAGLYDAAVHVADLTAPIAVEAARLPEPFHRDPADRMLVATARTLGCGLLTEDHRIRAYSHVDALDLGGLLRRGIR